jgi:hypothetical protein
MKLNALIASVLLGATAFVQAQNTGSVTQTSNIPKDSAVYPLSQEIVGSLRDAAAGSDILILGEVHGTQEVPAIAAALLAPLSQLGYQTLALEIPTYEKEAILAWAKGTTNVVPGFFATPWLDGRGNIELLTLIRTAVSAPFQWQLICFDEFTEGPATATPSQVELIAYEVKSDAVMAASLGDQYQRQKTKTKVLAICGNLHARTANHAPPDTIFHKFWPSFAAALKSKMPSWQISSLNIAIHRGAYFNGKINPFGDQAIEQVEFGRLKEKDWDFQLDLPHGTPATFLKAPSNEAMAKP